MMKKTLSLLLVFIVILISLTDAKAAVNISAKSKVQPMVTAGFNFSVILKEDGTVWSLGRNDCAVCGNSGFYYGGVSKLKQVIGLSDVVAIDSADYFTLALKRDGTVWGWGFNMYCGLGKGKPETCAYASQIVGISDVKAIAAGNHMSIFVKSDGTVWYVCQQSGKPSEMQTFKNMKDIVAVSSAHQSAIALTKDGKVWTWDWDNNGDGYRVGTPVKQKLSDIKSAVAGEFHYMALEKDGTLWTWGMNNHGEIGDGTHEWRYSPKKMTDIRNVKLIAAGCYFSYAELMDGTCYAWGNNECGQLGINSNKETVPKPVKMSGLKNVISMGSGLYHTIALTGNGQIYMMGTNDDEILGLKGEGNKLKPTLLTDLSKLKATSVKTEENYPNGDISDWGDVAPIAAGAAPKGEKLAGIKALYAKIGEDGGLHLAASITDGIPAFVNFNLDVNDDKKADYKLNFADEKYAMVYSYKIDGKTTKWTNDCHGVYGNVIEIIVPMEDLGYPEKISLSATYGADKKKNGVNTEIREYSVVPGSKIAVGDRSIKIGAITVDKA